MRVFKAHRKAFYLFIYFILFIIIIIIIIIILTNQKSVLERGIF